MSYADVTQLPDSLRAAVEAEVRDGEHVTWIDQPIVGRSVRASLAIVVFGLPWTAFSLFWTWSVFSMAHKHGAPGLAFAAFGLPFVAVGLGMLSAPYWVGRVVRRTLYVLTDRRAIIIVPGLRGTWVRSFDPSELHDLRREQREDGSGDLVFTMDTTWSRGGQRTSAIGFQAVADVRGVEDRVRALAQLGARTA
jgi:hypothetical protein